MMNMNYFIEISKKIEEFCNIIPYPDSRIDYLTSASKIRDLYLESVLLDGDGMEEKKRLIEIYNEISQIIG